MNKHIKIFLFVFILGCFTIILNPQDKDAADTVHKSKIVTSDYELIKVFGNGYSTEGPAAAPDGSIFFSDQTFTSETNMLAGIIWEYIPSKDTTIVFRSPSGMSNGLVLNKEGNLLVCEGADYGGQCITETNMKTGISSIVAGLYNNKPFNSPNDLVVDIKGRIFFTDPRYAGHEPIEQPVNGVYRIDTNSTVHLIIKNITMPNGIAISPDQRTLYIGCYDEDSDYDSTSEELKGMFIAEYNLLDNGNVSFRKIFALFKRGVGPDGIKIDKKGNLYVAVRDENNPRINIYSSDGRILREIKLPEVPSNLTFGKYKQENVIYITAGKSLYRIVIN